MFNRYKHAGPACFPFFPATIAKGWAAVLLLFLSLSFDLLEEKHVRIKMKGAWGISSSQLSSSRKGDSRALNPQLSVFHVIFEARWPGRLCFWLLWSFPIGSDLIHRDGNERLFLPSFAASSVLTRRVLAVEVHDPPPSPPALLHLPSAPLEEKPFLHVFQLMSFPTFLAENFCWFKEQDRTCRVFSLQGWSITKLER